MENARCAEAVAAVLTTDTIREAAAKLGVGATTVHRWIGQAVEMGLPRADLAKTLLASRRCAPAVEAPTVAKPARRPRGAVAAVEAPATAPAPVNEVAELQATIARLVAAQAQQSELIASLVSGKTKPKAAPAEERPICGGQVEEPTAKRLSGRKFVVTAAQNNTPVHPEFWKALQVFCRHNSAKLLVGRISYNKSGWGNQKITKNDDDLWYAEEIRAFVCNERVELAPGLIFCGEMDILPTSCDALSGLDNYTKTASGIFAHTQVALKAMPRLKGKPFRHLYTTGACTMRNYIQRKAGLKGEFRHTFSALVVEVDRDGEWFVRQLVAGDDGCFQDLTTVYTPDGTHSAELEAIAWGDLHIEKAVDEISTACWFARQSIIDILRPEKQILHDSLDFSARNHHNRHDPHFLAKMYARGTDKVEAGIKTVAEFLRRVDRPWCTTVIVDSNHDRALTRWVKEADVRQDPANAKHWFRYNYLCLDAIDRGDDSFNLFEVVVREMAELPRVVFLGADESYVICEEHGGIEVGMHGDLGPNGSRGTPKSFRNLGHRCTVAHGHSAAITDGVYACGVTGDLDMGYNCGPSSWSHSHVLHYKNGKRSIITMRGGKWRA